MNKKVIIVIVVIAVIGGILLTLWLMKKKNKSTSTSSTDNETRLDTGAAVVIADGGGGNALQTNPSSGNPANPQGGYTLAIGDTVYNRGTMPLTVIKVGSIGQMTQVAINGIVGTINYIDPNGNVGINRNGEQWRVNSNLSNNLGL